MESWFDLTPCHSPEVRGELKKTPDKYVFFFALWNVGIDIIV
jgi:hypothetical protein